jgi:hypothetical protein
MLTEIKSIITDKYKSLEFPNFSFKNNTPDSVCDVKNYLKERGYLIDDTTDVNEDVSSIISLSKEKNNWLLLLSWVGPFFTLVKSNGGNYKFYDENSSDIDDAVIVEGANKYGYSNIPTNLLFEKIQMAINLDGLEETEIYRAIYTNTDIFPWARI